MPAFATLGCVAGLRTACHSAAMRIWVIVNTLAEFVDWCVRHGVHPAAATPVTEPRSLRGQIAKTDRVIDARTAAAPAPRSLTAA